MLARERGYVINYNPASYREVPQFLHDALLDVSIELGFEETDYYLDSIEELERGIFDPQVVEKYRYDDDGELELK